MSRSLGSRARRVNGPTADLAGAGPAPDRAAEPAPDPTPERLAPRVADRAPGRTTDRATEGFAHRAQDGGVSMYNPGPPRRAGMAIPKPTRLR